VTAPGTETGDRTAFLARLRERLAGGVPENLAHPLPPPLDGVPLVRSNRLDPSDIVGSFIRNAEATRAVVHDRTVADGHMPDDLLAELVERHVVRRAVVSREPEARHIGDRLQDLGVAADRIVPTSAEVLRGLGDGRVLPSNLVLITGPSRSGDIEQIMALGVHGPLVVEIALLRAG